MLPGKSQSATQPTALGSLLQASTYGATIPTIYGMTLTNLLAIWAANLRQGGSEKKFKQLKKGITAYIENIDFLLGSNPIVGVNQLWINGANIPLEFTSITGTLPYTIMAGGVPDPLFYSVIGITATLPYSANFDDYGGTGPQALSGTFEAPLWNVYQNGPDPNDSGAYRYWPLTYQWKPSDGPTINAGSREFWVGGPNVTIYYTRVTDATSNQSPLVHNRMAFEPQLGSGTEYSDADLSSQQIIYDMYSGVGSSDIDLGSSGALPQLQAEVQGKFGTYATGDADFADMIEDVVKSGVAQAAIGAGDTAAGVTAIEHGLSGYDFPGVIQKITDNGVESFTQGPIPYPINVTAGNFLVVAFNGGAGTTVSIADTLANSWTAVFASGLGYQVWYAQANGSGANIVSVTHSGSSFSWQETLLEIAGVDTFDGVSIGTSEVSVATTNTSGFPAYLLNVNLWILETLPVDPQNPLWPAVVASNNNFYAPIQTEVSGIPPISWHQVLLERRVYSPGTYGIRQNTNYNTLPDVCCLLAFKCVNAPSYPRPVGSFIDEDSLNSVRMQCRANGLYGSLTMNSQQAASDWLKTLYDAADAAPVFMGFSLFSFPYSEVSAVGNGAIYRSPTSTGPVANLSDNNGDFVPAKDEPPIKVQTSARVDQPNVLQMQCINRTSNYNPSVVEQPDAAGISLFGVRKADPITNNAVQDVSIARQLLGIQVRKLQYGGDLYTFTLPAKWCLLAPMDLVTVTDPLADINAIPVRLTSITEQSDQSLECEAEPFVYGMYAPSPFSTDTPAPYNPNPNAPVSGGAGINPPIIFESTPRLAMQTSPAQIWIITSCPAANYGGCVPYISTDGGTSYTPVSETAVVGSAAQGAVVVPLPSATDPDTTNNFNVSLTLSGEPLASYSPAQRDNFQYPFYVGWPQIATSQAGFTVGDTSQITSLGILFSNPKMPQLPSDASIINIFPVIIYGATPADATATTDVFYGTGLTPTSGGTSFGSTTGVVAPPAYDYLVAGIGTTLTGQEIRYALGLPTNGGSATAGSISGAAWAILYSSAAPYPVDETLPPPFDNPPPSGISWAWAMPQTVATGTVGTGSNASVLADPAFPPTDIPYEIITYNSATLISPDIWEIDGTGSGNEIRRGVYAAPSPGQGMDHPFGSPFGALDPAGTGLVKINMDPTWIDVKLFFKFPTYNTFGGSLQSLANADVYSYTPTGLPGNTGPATGGILINGA